MNAIIALLVAVSASVIAGVALAFPFGGLNSLIAAASLSCGIIVGGLAYRNCARNNPPAKAMQMPGAWEWAVIAVYALFSIRAFCWLIFWRDGWLMFISDNNLGDLAIHLTYINNLANGVPFWPESPIFAGDKTRYPLGIDLFNSLLQLLGADVCRGLVCVGLAGCAATGVALWRWGRGFALAGFLLNGGLAGFQFFRTLHFADYQAQVAWKSIPLAMFVTQRGLLYAIPAGLVLLWSWRARYFSGEEDEIDKPLPLWIELLLYSTMPMFHLHTFVFLSLLLACWFVMPGFGRDAQQGAGARFSVLKFIACALLPATLLTGLVTGFFKTGSVLHWVHGGDWMYGEQPQFAAWAASLGVSSTISMPLGHIAAWLVNYGAFPFFTAALLWSICHALPTPAARRAVAFVVPAVMIYLFSYFVMLAPWDWDNNKVMIWSYLALLPFLWQRLLAKLPHAARFAACCVLFLSGFVSLVGGLDRSHTGYELADRAELEGVARGVRSLPADAIFAASSTYNHPLELNGRNVVMGYEGHLMSQGVDYRNQKALLDTLLNGGAGWRQTAEKLRVRYIFWGDREDEEYPDSEKPWTSECRKVAEGPWGDIYDLSTAH